MKAFFAVIFALCVLNTSVSAGTTTGCKAVLQQVKDHLKVFYGAGKQMEDNNAMTSESQKEFDESAYAVFSAVSQGCGGLTAAEYTPIAESILNSSPDCKKYAGEFVGQTIEGIKNGESQEGAWDALYEYCKICEA